MVCVLKKKESDFSTPLFSFPMYLYIVIMKETTWNINSIRCCHPTQCTHMCIYIYKQLKGWHLEKYE